MNLFVYTTLEDAQRVYLKSQLPDQVTPFFRDELPEAEWQAVFEKSDILLGNPPAKWFTEIPQRLTFWQLDSAGFDQYRQVTIEAKVANMGNFYARPCAESMLAGILAFYRGIDKLVKAQILKKWQYKETRAGLDLLGNKKVLILGAGAIGQACKQMLSGFGCPVQMTARTNPAADLHSFDEILEALPNIDVVINTLPGGADKYVSAEFIRHMQPGSLYASVGRGSTTDEQALLAAIQSGQLAGAVLDVTEQEPIPETNPLWEMENVILTQHTGGGYKFENEGKVKQFLANLHRLINQEPVQDVVDLSRGY